jgi:hypothetical protein
MSWFLRRRQKSFLIFVVGVTELFLPSAPIHAEQADPAEPCAALREQISAQIVLGTPDDRMRLQDAFDKAERELARLQLNVPTESAAQLAEKQHSLKEEQNRLIESEVLFRYLDGHSEETPIPGVDRPRAEERASLREELSGRIIALQKSIGTLEKEIRSDYDTYRQCIVGELNDLATLLTAKRADLVAEYARLPDCPAIDELCLKQKLRMLCDLNPLVSGAERLRLLRLIAEVDSRLNPEGSAESTSCETL